MKELAGVFLSGIILPPLLITLVSLFSKRQSKRLGDLTFIASVLSLCSSVALLFTLSQSELLYSFHLTLLIFTFSIDALSIYFILLVNVVALFASYFTKFASRQDDEPGEENSKGVTSTKFFHVEFNLFHCSMLLVPMVSNLLFLWVLIVFTTVVSAPLIGYYHHRRPQEAAWKYIMISSSGIVFALLGTIFLVSVFPNDINWSDLIQRLSAPGATVPENLKGIIKLSFLLILLGYGTKAGLFPMHTWLPDGHGEAPSPVSALLSGVLLKSALYVILRFYVITNLALAKPGQPDSFASNTLLIFGLLSLIMATPFILNTKKQNRFKRVLAYHSLEHMGIITFGFGLGIPLAFFGALFHALNHALAKTLMFLSYGNVQAVYAKEQIGDEDIRGVFQIMPLTGFLLALGGLALVGAPPFNIFFSEFIIFWAALQKVAMSRSPFWLVVAVSLFLISVTLIFGGLVVHLGRIVLGKSPISAKKVRKQWPQFIFLGGLLALLFYGGLTTFPLTGLLQQSVQILCQGVCQP